MNRHTEDFGACLLMLKQHKATLRRLMTLNMAETGNVLL